MVTETGAGAGTPTEAPPAHGLTDRQLAILRDILAPYAARIETVGLFGSRAAGTARPASDIDLVIYGSLSDADIDRLWTLFDDSALPVTVDVVAYERIAEPRLKAHIDQGMRPLFDGAALRASAP